MDLAMKMAAPLVNPKVPVWAQQMAAVMHEKRGEMDDALHIMESIRDNAPDISDADLRYMTYFVKERLHRLDEVDKFKSGKGNADAPEAIAPPSEINGK
jgi:hypothetical protein